MFATNKLEVLYKTIQWTISMSYFSHLRPPTDAELTLGFDLKIAR
jgi:hypothetical protein